MSLLQNIFASPQTSRSCHSNHFPSPQKSHRPRHSGHFTIFLEQPAPAFIPELRAQTVLHPLPSRRGQVELLSPRLRQGYQSLASIASLARCNPLASLHNRQRSRQRRRVQRQNLAQPPLRDLTRQRERLQNRKLRSLQPQRPQRFVIELRERPRRPAEGGAQARQDSVGYSVACPYAYRCIYMYLGSRDFLRTILIYGSAIKIPPNALKTMGGEQV